MMSGDGSFAHRAVCVFGNETPQRFRLVGLLTSGMVPLFRRSRLVPVLRASPGAKPKSKPYHPWEDVIEGKTNARDRRTRLPILPPERDARVGPDLSRVMLHTPASWPCCYSAGGFGITVELLMLSVRRPSSRPVHRHLPEVRGPILRQDWHLERVAGARRWPWCLRAPCRRCSMNSRTARCCARRRRY
jgi:hypothetical protein